MAPHLSDGPIEQEERHGVANYAPLPVVLVHGEGAWVTDDAGVRYLDLLAGYSALNFGHRHPDLVEAARRQLDQLTLTSRAFHTDLLGPFCSGVAELVGLDRTLPMNTGAEAVETALKAARKWGYEVKGVPSDHAEIVVFDGNFHGRTITIVGFSSDPDSRRNFGPFTPGFISVPYGDLEAASEAIARPNVVAVLVEPIQGEAGVRIPPAGFLTGLRRACDTHGVLLVADEVQSGLGRTGEVLASDHEGVRPDLVILGKALGGGILPVSAVVGTDEVLGLFRPGEHGSTFGGNPLACAVGLAVLDLLADRTLLDRSRQLGSRFLTSLVDANHPAVAAVRGRGLWIGLDLVDEAPTAREVGFRLLERRILTKDTHGQTLRFSPPLVISDDDLDAALSEIHQVLADLSV